MPVAQWLEHHAYNVAVTGSTPVWRTMHYVYFLWSDSLQKIYIGQTSNVRERVEFHNLGLQRYTKKGIPWKLIALVSFESKNEALKEERRLKKCRNKEYYKWYMLTHGKKLNSGVSPDQVGI